jgi:hypothetical protein
MQIIANRIIYADHEVVLDKELHKDMPEYIVEMADDLSPNGSVSDHAEELERMNNDGSWTVVPNKTKRKI